METSTKESRSGCINIRQSRLRAKKITKDKEGHYIMINKSIHKENMASQVCVHHGTGLKIHKAKIMEPKGKQTNAQF